MTGVRSTLVVSRSKSNPRVTETVVGTSTPASVVEAEFSPDYLRERVSCNAVGPEDLRVTTIRVGAVRHRLVGVQRCEQRSPEVVERREEGLRRVARRARAEQLDPPDLTSSEHVNAVVDLHALRGRWECVIWMFFVASELPELVSAEVGRCDEVGVDDSPLVPQAIGGFPVVATLLLLPPIFGGAPALARGREE